MFPIFKPTRFLAIIKSKIAVFHDFTQLFKPPQLYFPLSFPLTSHFPCGINKSEQTKRPLSVDLQVTIGLGNNPMVGMTVSTAVSIEEAAKAGKF